MQEKFIELLEKKAFFGSIGASAAEGFGNALGDRSLNMIGKMGDSIMSSMQRRNKDKILKDMSVMYPQLSNRDKQKVNIAFEMICTLRPSLLNNSLLAGKIIDDASKSVDVISAVKSKLDSIKDE